MADGNKHSKTGAFLDKKTREKIEKHLRDADDTISDDDIRNAITDISSPDNVDPNDTTNTYVREDENLSGSDSDSPDESEQLPTSWNIIE